MRRGTLAIIGLLLASTAMPSSAEARPLLFRMMGALTSPLRAVLGGGRAGHRAPYRHRAWASHRSPAAVAAAPAVAVGAAAGFAPEFPGISESLEHRLQSGNRCPHH